MLPPPALPYPGGITFEVYGKDYGDTSFFTSHLRSQTPFAMLRLSDLDWFCILGRAVPSMQPYMEQVVRCPRPDVVYGMARAVPEFIWADVEPVYKKWCQHIPWFDADPLGDACRAGRLRPFIDAVNERDVVTVGPDHLDRLSFLKVRRRIPTLPANCDSEFDRIHADVRDDMRAHPGTVYLFSAWVPGKAIIYQLYDGRSTLIDCGSIWDVHAGLCTRRWHKKVIAEGKVLT